MRFRWKDQCIHRRGTEDAASAQRKEIMVSSSSADLCELRYSAVNEVSEVAQ